MKRAVLAAIVIAVVLIVLIETAATALDPVARAEAAHRAALRQAERETLAPVWLTVKLVAAGTAVVALLALGGIAIAAAMTAWAGVARARNRAALVYPEHGLYPAIVQPIGSGGGNLLLSAGGSPTIGLLPGPNEPRAQLVAALTNGALSRIPSGAMRPILRPEPETALLPDPEPGPVNVRIEDALRIDPHDPHWLLIGGTGSGKSKAIYNILDRLSQQAHIETLICEVDGTDWNHLAAATTLDGYLAALEAVEVERQRRVTLLRAADVDHISRLVEPPPYLVVVLEEAESVYGNMARLGRDAAQRFTQLLRDLASMGRKQGIMLVVATQTGTSQVFDVPTRKNFGHRFIFRSEPGVGDAWGLARSVGLPTLAPGTAYDLGHGGLVHFPLIQRPTHLPMSPLYRDPVSGPVREAVYQPEAGVWVAESDIPAFVPDEIPPTITSPTELTPGQIDRIRAAYARQLSIRGVERELWPGVEHGGTKFYVVREVLQKGKS